jgi:hypothetical protein
MQQNLEKATRFSPCKNCEKPVEILTKYQRDRLHVPGGWVHCSRECAKAYSSRASSAAMAKTNRKYASDRMIARNPMRNPESRAKMSETLQRIGHKPKVQGGNGRGPSVAQSLLYAALQSCGYLVQTEYVYSVGLGKYAGYPTHYKIDIAIPALKIAIEVDGFSHCALDRQKQDAKKQALLTERGWSVLRFTNREAVENLSECCQMVMSTISKLTSITTILPTEC